MKTASPLDEVTVGNVMQTTARAFSIGFWVRGCAALLPRLLQPRRLLSIQVWRHEIFNRYAFRFGLFLATTCGGYKLMRLLLRKVRGVEDQFSIRLAAAVSAAGVMWVPHLKTTIALYVFCRAVDDYWSSKFMEGHVRKPKSLYVWAFAFVNLLVGGFYCSAPRYINNGYYRWITAQGVLSHNLLEYYFRTPMTLVTPTPGPFRECTTMFHPQESCVAGNWWRFKGAFARAIRMYIPVHFIPLLAFRLRRFLNDPANATVKTVGKAFRSSLFLASYVSIMAGCQCLLRQTNRGDSALQAAIGGFFAGFSLFIEAPSRRSELVLYCLPRALEGVWNIGKEKLLDPRSALVQHVSGSLLLMSAGMMIAMRNYTTSPTAMKTVNNIVFSWLFGEN